LQGPISSLPNFVGAALNFLVSMKRIQDFLMCDEVDHNLIENGQGSNAVEISNSSFHWGFEKKDEEDDKKKKKTKKVKGKKDDIKEQLLDTESAAVDAAKEKDFILKSLDL